MTGFTNPTMYDTLLQLPLFQGLSRADLTRILERVKLEFVSFNESTTIVRQGETCDKLLFLLDGELTMQYHDCQRNFMVSTNINGTQAVEVSSLFGRENIFRNTYIALAGCKLMVIDKTFVLNTLMNYRIVQLNLLNMLCSNVQGMANKISHAINELDIKKRFTMFLECHGLQPSSESWLYINMNTLAKCLGTTRLNVSHMLNELQDHGMLEISRSKIHLMHTRNI